MQSSPVPTAPNFLHWMNVDTPDAKSAIDTRKLVVSMSSCICDAIIKGGVIIATKIANKCCNAANTDSTNGGRSLSP